MWGKRIPEGRGALAAAQGTGERCHPGKGTVHVVLLSMEGSRAIAAKLTNARLHLQEFMPQMFSVVK